MDFENNNHNEWGDEPYGVTTEQSTDGVVSNFDSADKVEPTSLSYPPQPGSGYTYQNAAHSYNPPHSAFTPPTPPEEPKKEPRRFGLGAVIALVLCAALISGSVSAAVVGNYISANGQSGSSVSTTKTDITITDQSTNAVEAVASAVTPSVVGIRATAQSQQNIFGFGQQSDSSGSEGSGVIYSSDGYIITNCHVISSVISYGGSIEVFLPDDPDTAISANLVGYDSSTDLAVLKIDKTGLTAIKIGSSADLTVGEMVIAVGNPGGLSFLGSISVGYISGLNRSLQIDSVTMTLIQTDAAINPGNSGGALVDSEGKLVGIPNVKISDDDFEGMGFAIPVDTVVEICNDLITNQSKPKPYIGVEISTRYTSAILERMGYPAGVVVAGVTTGGPAANAGIKSGDIITAINGNAITSYNELSDAISKCSVGDKLTVTVYRSGRSTDITVTVGSTNK